MVKLVNSAHQRTQCGSCGRPALIHGVRHVFAAPVWLDRWPSDDKRTRIVFIGEAIPRHFPARLLDAIEAEVIDETRRQTWN